MGDWRDVRLRRIRRQLQGADVHPMARATRVVDQNQANFGVIGGRIHCIYAVRDPQLAHQARRTFGTANLPRPIRREPYEFTQQPTVTDRTSEKKAIEPSI